MSGSPQNSALFSVVFGVGLDKKSRYAELRQATNARLDAGR
jgi:hypothetical protein